MATTRTADQLLADLAALEFTCVDEYPAHATHPSLPAIPYRITEQKIFDIHFNGRVVVVWYHVQVYGYLPGDNYEFKRTRELKPTASVKRQLEKFIDCTFTSRTEFKAVLLDEPIMDEPGDQVVSAAGIIDASNQNNFVVLGAGELAENKEVDVMNVRVNINYIRSENGVLVLVKAYSVDGDGITLALCDDSDDHNGDEECWYEYVKLTPNAQVRQLLRQAGLAGNWCAYDTKQTHEILDLLRPQARRDKFKLLVAA